MSTLADFNTHVFGAATVISLGATCATKLLSLTMPEGLMLMMVGMIGGVLPDVDLRSSQPSKALFSVLGVVAGLAWLFANMADFTGLELWLGTIVVFLLVRFPTAYIFHRMSVHRGVLHSLIAAIMAGVLTCAIAYQHMQSALKPLDMQQLPASCLVIFITLVAWFWCAPLEQALAQLSDRYSDWRPVLIPKWL